MTVHLYELPEPARKAVLRFEIAMLEISRRANEVDAAKIEMADAREAMINAILESKT